MIGVLATLGCDGESSDSLPNDSGRSADSQSNDCVEANNCCSGDIASDGLGYIRLPLQLPTVQQLPSDSVIGVVEEIGVWPDDDTASFLRVSGQQVYLPFTLAEIEHIDNGPALKVEVTVKVASYLETALPTTYELQKKRVGHWYCVASPLCQRYQLHYH